MFPLLYKTGSHRVFSYPEGEREKSPSFYNQWQGNRFKPNSFYSIYHEEMAGGGLSSMQIAYIINGRPLVQKY